MRDAIQNLLTFNQQNLIAEIWWLSAIIWLVVVCCALTSVWSMKIHAAWRAVWSVLIIGVPFVGLLLYCVFAVTKVKILFFTGKAKGKGGSGYGGHYGPPKQKSRSKRSEKAASVRLVSGQESNGRQPEAL